MEPTNNAMLTKLNEVGVNSYHIRLAAVGILGLVILQPFLWSAFLASLDIAGIAILGGLGLGASFFLPYFGQKLENKVLQLRKDEARRKPIEQMQNQLLRRTEQLGQFKGALLKIASKIKSLERAIEERAKSCPGHDLSGTRKSLDAMNTYYQQQKGRLKQAEKTLEEFKFAVDQKIFEHDFAQAGQDIWQGISKTGKESLQQDMLTDEAFKSVEAAFDEAFASLEFEDRFEDELLKKAA